MREPLLRRPLAASGANELRHLGLHQLLADPTQALAQHVDSLPFEEVADDLIDVILWTSAIVVTPLVVVFVDPTSLSATVAPGSVRRALTPTYGT